MQGTRWPGKQWSVALALAITALACRESTDPPKPVAQTKAVFAPADMFETDGLLGGKEAVVVKPMIESNNAVQLRARQAGVEPTSIQAKAYGIKFYVVDKDAEVGTAFMHRTQVYHLPGLKGQIIVDEAYFYCAGFLSTDIVKVTERFWSRYYPSDSAGITRLDTLAEAVRAGAGYKDAYMALGLGSDLLTNGSEERNKLEREVTWFVGRQAIEQVNIDLARSNEVGNRISVRFVQ